MKFMIGNWSNILACIKRQVFYRRWIFHVHRRSYVVLAFKRHMTSVSVPDERWIRSVHAHAYSNTSRQCSSFSVLPGCSNVS